MSAAGSSTSNASSSASARPFPLSPTATTSHLQQTHIAPVSPSSAGATPPYSSSHLRAPYQETASTSNPRSPTRFVSSLRPPSPPQQEISEKVRDAFEDLELDNIPHSDSMLNTGRNHARARSRSPSRGRRLERADKNASEREWDEKRGLAQRYGEPASGSGASNARAHQVCHETIRAPLRSSSLTNASFSSPQSNITRSAVNSSFASPPPYSSRAAPSYPSSYSSYSSSVRRMLLVERIRPWLPFLAYGATTLGFALAIAFWRDEVFGSLDELAQWLRAEETTGYAVMFLLIFLTCIPPIPLYSTLQILSGYTFGTWTGGVVSYFSALAGALFVFSISRSVPSLRCAITSCMSHSRALQRVVRAISKRPSLLFLVRLAPYPYNVLNALLAGCPRLTFRTYASCTALSLFKVIVHTSVGAGIKSFADYHSPSKATSSSLADESGKDEENSIGRLSTIVGAVLCIVLAVYLSLVARRAVDEELEDEDDLECGRGRSRLRARAVYGVRADEEESTGFLEESTGESLGPDFAQFVNPSTRSQDRVGASQNGEMVERDNTARSMPSSPAPLSSLSAVPHSLPEWTR